MSKLGTSSERIEARKLLSAFNFMTRRLVDASPDTGNRGALQRAVKIQSDWTVLHAKYVREDFEEAGVQPQASSELTESNTLSTPHP